MCKMQGGSAARCHVQCTTLLVNSGSGQDWALKRLLTFGFDALLQAMISGAFSIVKQSIALGCFPRLEIKHTSEKFGGQIYIPFINWSLMVLTVAVVAGFQSGTAIGNGCVADKVLTGDLSFMCVTTPQLVTDGADCGFACRCLEQRSDWQRVLLIYR